MPTAKQELLSCHPPRVTNSATSVFKLP
uniref:Uncharacterized protein n=1 Tax=Arundo donax TaxID=35708 RepID=A0A0A9BD35_ARUDO